MPDNSFPVGYPPDAVHGLKGSTLNKLGNTLNALAGHGVQHGAVSVNGVTKSSIPAPEFIFGMAKIIGASDLCATDTTEPDSRGFPCRTSNKYVVNFRFWDHDQGDFVAYEQDWEMDAGGYWESSDTEASKAPTSGVGYGPIPVYAVGDVVPAYLDRHRGKVIPVHSPYCDDPSAVFFTRAQQVIQTVEAIGAYAAVVLEMKRPGIDQDWLPIAAIDFPLVYPDLGANTYASSSAFNTVPCPHSTLFRVRHYRGDDASEGSDLVVTMIVGRLRFTGVGRRSPYVTAKATRDDVAQGGQIHTGWGIDAETVHRFKDAPYFAVPSGDSSAEQIQATYFDPKDEWMVGVEIYAAINIAIDEFSSSSSPSSQSSSSSSLSSSSSSSSSTSSLSSSSSTSTLSSSSTSTLSSSSSSHSRSSSSTSASISTSSSSYSRSTSSSSGFDCIKVPECYEFNEETCVMTITWAELCFPRGTMTVTHDVDPPC